MGHDRVVGWRQDRGEPQVRFWIEDQYCLEISTLVECTKKENRMLIKKIYIDLDGVLADFDKGVRELCGLEPRYQNGKVSTIDAGAWWARVAAVEHFYAKLDLIPGAKEMFDVLYDRYGAACEILSALPRPHRGVKYAAEDKTEWVRRLVSEKVVLNLVYRDDKKDFCTGKDCILIDDLEKNIEEWEANGGTGVLFKDPQAVVDAIVQYEMKFENDYS